MSAPQSTLTYEGVLEVFRQVAEQMKETDQKLERMFQATDQRIDRKFQETAEQIKKTDLQIERTNKDVGGLTSSIGNLIASMVKGNIIEKFQALGYNNLDDYCEKKKFKNSKLGIDGEIDLFVENGDIAILIEVKTTLETSDVRKHLKRLANFRRCIDAKGVDKRRFIGAVAGATVVGDAAEVALENGLYVIVQSGESFDFLPQPVGFVAKKW
jgi:hypothetical protein